jgi:hypothetical protein
MKCEICLGQHLTKDHAKATKRPDVSESSLDGLFDVMSVTEAIEAVSTKVSADFDQSTRNLVRIIVDHGQDYVDTEFGDMTLPLLKDLLKIVKHAE